MFRKETVVEIESLSEKEITWREPGESVEHEADHGEVDKGFGAGFSGLVVADEASVLHEPPKGAFDDPALGQHHEADGSLVAFDDLAPSAGRCSRAFWAKSSPV
jgi:hypothetical protein